MLVPAAKRFLQAFELGDLESMALLDSRGRQDRCIRRARSTIKQTVYKPRSYSLLKPLLYKRRIDYWYWLYLYTINCDSHLTKSLIDSPSRTLTSVGHILLSSIIPSSPSSFSCNSCCTPLCEQRSEGRLDLINNQGKHQDMFAGTFTAFASLQKQGLLVHDCLRHYNPPCLDRSIGWLMVLLVFFLCFCAFWFFGFQ